MAVITRSIRGTRAPAQLELELTPQQKRGENKNETATLSFGSCYTLDGRVFWYCWEMQRLFLSFFFGSSESTKGCAINRNRQKINKTTLGVILYIIRMYFASDLLPS